MRRQLIQRTRVTTVSLAILAIGALLVSATDRITADDVVPGAIDTRPSFEDAVANGQQDARCEFCEAWDGTVCGSHQCGQSGANAFTLSSPEAFDAVDPAETLFVPIVPSAQSAGFDLELPSPWWSQLPTPTVRSAKALFVTDSSSEGPALSATSLCDPSVATASAEVAATCPLGSSCASAARDINECSYASCDAAVCPDVAAELASATPHARVCTRQGCSSGSCSKCDAHPSEAYVEEECTAANCSANKCDTSECAAEAVATDPVAERSVTEIIEIVDSLGQSVVAGTVFDDAPACKDSPICRGDGSCREGNECVVDDHSCAPARSALIAELRNLAAATAREEADCASPDSVQPAPTGQAAAPVASPQPVSVLTVQNPYVVPSAEPPVCIASHRQAASRIDATADTLEVDGLYETADMLRQIADDLRLKAREQAAAHPVAIPHPVPYAPVYPAMPPAPAVGPVSPDACEPTGQWSMPVLEAFRRGGWQPPGVHGLE